MAKITVKNFKKAIKGSSGNMTVIAKRLDVSRSTLYVWVGKRPKMDELRLEMKQVFKDIAYRKLEDHIMAGSEKSLHFYLKTQHEDFQKDRRPAGGSGDIKIVVQTAEEKEAIDRMINDEL